MTIKLVDKFQMLYSLSTAIYNLKPVYDHGFILIHDDVNIQGT